MNRIISALIVGGLMVVAGLGIKYLGAHGFIAGTPEEIGQRSFNVVLGLLVIWLANASPKKLRPLDSIEGGVEREQSVRRFSARAIVIGSLLYCLAWLAVPFDLALPLSIAALGGSIVLVIGRCLLGRMAKSQS